MEKIFVHLFKTPLNFYAYDVNKNTLLKIDKDLYDKLEKENKDLLKDDSFLELKQLGYFSTNRVKEIMHSTKTMLKFYLENKLKMITLQVTQECNLRCEYCVYSGTYENRGHSSKRMSFETAKKGIDFLINHSIDNNSIAVGFYGGEPLLELELIKDCITYARKKAEGKILNFTITTNATLLTEEIVKYFIEENISTVISLDGPKEVHDSNRRFAYNNCGTFEKISENLQMIKEKFPGYMKKIMFNVVMDPRNNFSCINNFFTDYDIFKDSMLTSTTVNELYRKDDILGSYKFEIERQYELFKFFLYKLGRIEKEKVSRLVINYNDRIKKYDSGFKPMEKLPETSHHSGPCIPGAQRLFLNTDGILFPCERVSEASDVMKIGNIDTGFDINKVSNIVNIGEITEKECKNCWAFINCFLCASSADALTSFSAEQKKIRCDEVRASVEEDLRNYCALKELGYSKYNEIFKDLT